MEKAVVPTIRITLRLPADVHAALKEAAPGNERVLNSEIVYRLRQSFRAEAEATQQSIKPEAAKILPVPPAPSNASPGE